VRATQAEIAEWEARLDRVTGERDYAERRANMAEAQLGYFREALAREIRLVDLIAAMGAALAQKVEGKG
jgi:hypothetical protein